MLYQLKAQSAKTSACLQMQQNDFDASLGSWTVLSPHAYRQ